ncbi:MAG: sel1 repeat family protein [Sneathiella sp.]|nr:sel1 repeat family protein [Sneathiella sp.]
MRNNKSLLRIILPVLLLAAIITTVAYFSRSSWSSKNTVWDRLVNEDMNQAKTLQKLGKLKEALAIYEKHAANDHPVSMFYAAKFYSRGWSKAPNLNIARGYYLKAVEYSFPYRGETAYELGRLFQRSKGADCNIVAIEWFKNALKWNYVKAALQLAIHHEKGLGVEPDMDRASSFYEIVVAAENEQAMIKYARLLINHKYASKLDPAKSEALVNQAMILLKRKAHAGSGTAAKQLGRLYRRGKLVFQDNSKAKKWLMKAAHLGSTGGMHDYAHILLADTKHPERHPEAIQWLRSAADRGHGGSMTALGRFHLDEKYNLTRAASVMWFERGSEVPHGGSLEELARLYNLGLLVSQDREKAIEFAERGNRLGHSGSTKLLAEILNEKAASELISPNTATIKR